MGQYLPLGPSHAGAADVNRATTQTAARAGFDAEYVLEKNLVTFGGRFSHLRIAGT